MSRSILITAILLVASLLAGAPTVQAQESRIHGYALGGYSNTLGSTADYLQGGFILGGGFSVSPSWLSPFDLRFDLSYSQYNASIALLNNGNRLIKNEACKMKQ